MNNEKVIIPFKEVLKNNLIIITLCCVNAHCGISLYKIGTENKHTIFQNTFIILPLKLQNTIRIKDNFIKT